MTILIAYRPRGAFTYSHHFHVAPWQWRGFYSHARLYRQSGEYFIVRHGDYVPVLA